METSFRNYLYDKLFTDSDYYDVSAKSNVILMTKIREYFNNLNETSHKSCIESLIEMAKNTLHTYIKDRNTKNLNESINHFLMAKQFIQTNNSKDIIENELNAAIEELIALDSNQYSENDLTKIFRLHFKIYYEREQFHLAKNQLENCLQDISVLYRLLKDYPSIGQTIHLISQKMEKLHNHVIYILEQSRPEILEEISEISDFETIPDNYHKRLEFCMNFMKQYCKTYLYSSCIFSEGERISRTQIDKRLQFLHTDKRGNHIKAKEVIEENFVVLSEIPDSSSVGNNYLKTKCLNCIKNLHKIVIPCNHCKEVTFCSLFCRDEAYQHFHRYECGILGYLNRISLATSQTFRILSRVGIRQAIEHDPKQFKISEYFKNDYVCKKNCAEFTNDDELLLYKMSASLATHAHSKKFKKHDNIVYVLDCINLTLVLIIIHNQNLNINADSENFSFYASEEGEKFFLSLLSLCFQFVRRISVNVFGEFDYKNNNKETMATLKLLLGSYFNHSCEPNLYWEVKEGKIAFKTKRSILSNEELTITYGATRATGCFIDRQLRLDHFQFICTCEMCSQEITFQENVVRCPNCKMEPLFIVKNAPICSGCQKSFDFNTISEKNINLKYNEEYIKILIQSSENNSKLWNKKRFKKILIPILKQINETAYELSWPFLNVLSNIAKICVISGQGKIAMESCQRYNQIFEELNSKLNFSKLNSDFDKKPFYEERLREIDFWSDLCFKNILPKSRSDYELACKLFTRLFDFIEEFKLKYLVNVDLKNIYINFLDQIASRKMNEYQELKKLFN